MNDSEQATSFRRMVEEIQRQIDEQARAVYSATVIEHVYYPQNMGRMQSPDAGGVFTGWCGDTMEIHLRLDGEWIEEATFMTDGCGPSVACGSMLTTMVSEMPLERANEVTAEDLLAALHGLPEESEHCAELAVSALRAAIVNYRQKVRDSR
jgi:nitrogen fixation NifU-like protein